MHDNQSDCHHCHRVTSSIALDGLENSLYRLKVPMNDLSDKHMV